MSVVASIARSKILYCVAILRTGCTIAGVSAVANVVSFIPRSFSPSKWASRTKIANASERWLFDQRAVS